MYNPIPMFEHCGLWLIFNQIIAEIEHLGGILVRICTGISVPVFASKEQH